MQNPAGVDSGTLDPWAPLLRVIQDVTNDGGSVFLLRILFSQKNQSYSVSRLCAALITVNDNSCYFVVIFFPAKWK